MKGKTNESGYVPPFAVSAEAITLIADISAQIERYAIRLEQEDGLRLRRANRIKTIHSSLAIEGNTLSEEEVRDIIDGKNVVAPIKQIQEVKNAIKTYELYPSLDPFKEKDLLKAHGVMMQALVDNPGRYRSSGVGVFGEKGIVHLAPPAERVPMLMGDLFHWLKHSKDHLLIRSCVFHYEFEFIHPFPDGNGRTGRLWQTALLGSWRNEFYGAPVENIVWAHQQEYYQAIRASTAAGECGPFIDFMLDKILRTLKAKGKAYGAANEKGSQKGSQKSDQKILSIMKSMPDITMAEIANATGLSIAGVKKNIRKLKDANLIRRIGPDKGGHWEVI